MSMLALLPVTILLGLIAFHGSKIVTAHDDPQRSGAFAMFATVDLGATRRVIATTTIRDKSVVLEIPQSLEDLRKRLADTPSRNSARELGSMLLDMSWAVRDDTAIQGGNLRFERVRVQVVGLRAERRTLRRFTLADVVAEQ